MKLFIHTPAKALSKAYLRHSLRRDQIDLFKNGLARMFERIRTDEHEEHLKNIVSDFLKDTWYKQTNEINTSGRTDLVIHSGKNSSDPVAVLIEVKRPGNNSEMISPERPNAKALHELLHYYLGERYLRDNKEIKHLIVCNIYEWYIFDAADFERFFFANKKLTKAYKDWSDGLFGLKNTDWFYQEIARPFIEKELEELPCTCFDIRDFEKVIRKPEGEDDKKLIALFKVLSPPHLLKQPFANDANSLNREFYNELLHIIGLEEVKEKGKKLINRKAPERRNEGSLLENAINMLKVQRSLEQLDNPEQFGSTDDERLFSIGLELCIIWLNRILFLKLLEGQLIAYHRGDRGYAFLKNDKVTDFDDLQELFFEVLARRLDERSPGVTAKFGAIPYLNSSLFEISDLERKTIQVSNLKGRLEMSAHGATVLKDAGGKRISCNRNTLGYLFDFLDAYDFASEGKADIQETAKTIINASVLGLIFEKINGYRDGSFYTPGFITMYMSREAIRRAVVQKFRDANLPGCQNLADFDDLVDKLDYTDKEVRQRANNIINSLRLCDPAVGSGHFLVSALNELIAVKNDLHILTDRDGKRLHGCVVSIENDELIVTIEDELFVYNPKDPESRRIQEALFHEKQVIIEQCLFGVDINPKSVAICRLRLWIELLKNAYYTKESGYAEMETLPNIDINIKCGNSLVNRFALGVGSGRQQLSPVELNKRQQLTKHYKEKVWQYKLAPTNKAILRREIESLKEDFTALALPTDRDVQTLRAKKSEWGNLAFAFDKIDQKRKEKLAGEIDELELRVAEKRRTLYGNAFEWRFEFPEVLDESGDFIGFDLIIGNPPYIRIQDLKETSPSEVRFFKDRYISAEKGNYDIYVVFVECGLSLLNAHGRLSFILPHKFFNAQYGEPLRKLVAEGGHLAEIVHFGHEMIFDEASAYTCILSLDQARSERFRFIKVNDVSGWNSSLQGACIEAFIPACAATSADWNFTLGDGAGLLERLSGIPLTLELATSRIFQGLKTSADKIYIVEELERTSDAVRVFSPEKQAEYRLEPDLLHRLVKGGDSAAYCLTPTNRLILFPYEVGVSGKGELLSAEQIQERFPLTWAYLCDNRTYLENREHGKMRTAGWYGYGRVQALDVISLPKIFTPDLAPQPRFSLDETGEHFFTGGAAGGYGILVDDGYDRRYILAILNSRLSGWFINQTATQMRGGWRSYEARFIKHIPIHPIDVTDADEKARHDRIAELVDNILTAYKTDSQAGVSTLEAEIDLLVYSLYDLTDVEIAVVEGKK